jgi:hypothetical protein
LCGLAVVGRVRRRVVDAPVRLRVVVDPPVRVRVVVDAPVRVRVGVGAPIRAPLVAAPVRGVGALRPGCRAGWSTAGRRGR